MKPSILLLSTLLLAFSTPPKDKKVGDGCEACELMFEGMPTNLTWQTVVAPSEEPGERLELTGTIYKPDGKTPAPHVVLYVYQTDNKGLYSKGPSQPRATRHGRLRGWMKTDAQGRYKFTTIRPASYPNSNIPQHIHPIIKEPGLSLYWIDEFLFEDDPMLTQQERAKQEGRGGMGILKVAKNANGVWVGTRNIILGKNIPNY